MKMMQRIRSSKVGSFASRFREVDARHKIVQGNKNAQNYKIGIKNLLIFERL